MRLVTRTAISVPIFAPRPGLIHVDATFPLCAKQQCLIPIFPSPAPRPSPPQKVRAYLAANPDSASTLEKLLAHDKTSHPNPKDRHTTGGLMWLLRGLKFTSMGLRINLDNPTEELSTSFTKGYEGSLKKWHGFAVRPIFYVSEARRGNGLVDEPS